MPLGHCSVLFGIPTSWDEYERACRRSPRSDYLLHVEYPPATWEEEYNEVADAAQELIATATRLGARVVREATLADLAHATVASTIVILIAHFRGYEFAEEDVLVDVDQIFAVIEGSSSGPLSHIAPTLRQLDSLIEALNAAILERNLLRFLPAPVAEAVRDSVPVGRVLCRDLLDEALDGMMKSGNSVDLWDGLHTLAAAEAAIWQDFEGELDLALCNSVAFATCIDLNRVGRVHHLHWPDLIDPIPQLILIAETLRRIERQGETYISTRLRLEGEILQFKHTMQPKRKKMNDCR